MKVIVTGATGMVGEGVLLVCLNHPEIEEVLVISRKSTGKVHSKLKEAILPDFSTLGALKDQLTNYDACFFCAGISSIGHTEESFFRGTYEMVVPFARQLSEINPKSTFIYVSGAGTDSSEIGKVIWARVKGKTENALSKLPFASVHNFRPGFMKPVKGQTQIKGWLKLAYVLWPLMYLFMPAWSCSLEQVALAMIQLAKTKKDVNPVEVKDMKRLATESA
ncbi:epimerase [Bacteroidota bacterium]